MDTRKLFVYVALVFVGFSLWDAWQKEHTPTDLNTQTVQENVLTQEAGPYIPSSTASENKTRGNVAVAKRADIPQKRLVTVKTDVLELSIDTLGGNVVKANLLDYPESLEDKTPVTLFNDDIDDTYMAQSGLSSKRKSKPIQYSVSKRSYSLGVGENELLVELRGQNNQGISVVKTFTIKRNDYLVNVNFQAKNNSGKTWSGQFYTQIVRNEPDSNSPMFQMSSYTGASISDPAKKLYEKISFKDMNKEKLSRTVEGGWIAMQQHYFVSAWVPKKIQQNYLYSNVSQSGLYTIGLMSPSLKLSPGETTNYDSQLYVGPEIASTLKQIAPGLDMTIDYGFLWPISVALFWLLQQIFNIVGNWGWSIVLVTLVIKLVFYSLSSTSYRSMAKMRQLQPKLTALKERYGDDKQKFSQAMMELYKTEKVNPLGGCLPIVVQIPFFIGLYWVLLESVQLRQAPFFLWIHDLAAPDPFYILPIIMGVTYFIQQKLSPPPPDPTQAKVMMFLPVVFTFLFMNFPSGLVLYWVANNVFSILQQWYVTYKFEHQGSSAKALKKA